MLWGSSSPAPKKAPPPMGCASPGLSLYSRDASSLSFDQMMSGVSSCPSTDREQSCLQTQAKSGRNDWGGWIHKISKPPTASAPADPQSGQEADTRHQLGIPCTKGAPPQQQQQPGPRQGRPHSSHAPLRGRYPSHQEKLSCQQESPHPNTGPPIKRRSSNAL